MEHATRLDVVLTLHVLLVFLLRESLTAVALAEGYLAVLIAEVHGLWF